MNIILAGDSLTEGMDVARYFTGSNVINKGVYGDNLEGLSARLDRDVISQAPDLLFILIGTNDFALAYSNNEILAGFKKMADKLSSALSGTVIYIASLLPTRNIENRPNDRIDELNRHLEVQVQEANLGFLALNDIFKDEAGLLRKDATTDGLHLSGKGYKIWADVLNEYIRFYEKKKGKTAAFR